MDLYIFLNSLLIGLVVFYFSINFAKLVEYHLSKQVFERRTEILLTKSESMKKLRGSEKSLFRLEGEEMDNLQRLFARFNYSLFMDIKKLIHFAELGEKLNMRKFILYSISCVIFLALAFSLTIPHLMMFSVLGVIIPYLYVHYLKDKKIKSFVNHFPSVLESIASNLKAGADVVRAVRVVAYDEENLFSKDFKLILAEIELGVPIAEAFENYANKIGIAEVNLFSMGIKLSMQTGANLSEFFTKISEMIRKRIELKGKINIVTSEGRFSMVVMCLAPVIVGIVQTMFDPVRYIAFLQSFVGQVLVYGGIFMIGLAIFWVSSMMNIEDS